MPISRPAPVLPPVQLKTGPNAALVRVSAVRSRVLCPTCQGENDEEFTFCQWCWESSETDKNTTTDATMIIDDKALNIRFLQFEKAQAARASEKRRNATTILFNRFLRSLNNGVTKHVAQAHPKDMVDFLC